MILEIIFENEEIIAINKPHGLLVHKTRIAKDVSISAMQILRDQIGMKVYPSHRIDRKTSGVLLFSKSKDVDSRIQQKFMQREVEKRYWAIVRGWMYGSDTIDYPIESKGRKRDSQTEYDVLEHFEINRPNDRYETSRYSLLELNPLTGRHHQIRRHLAHIRHPILGDRPHGCAKQNKLWKNEFNMTSMMLHAAELKIRMKKDSQFIHIKAPISDEFQRVLHILKSN